MQHESTSSTSQDQDTHPANVGLMTGLEQLQCEHCGHKAAPRPANRPNILPCGMCGHRSWQARPLFAGPSRLVRAT